MKLAMPRNRLWNAAMLLTFGVLHTFGSRSIQDYRPNIGQALESGKTPALICLRSFFWNGKLHLLLVDPDSLVTSVRPADHFRFTEMSWIQIGTIFKESAYIKALEDDQSRAGPIQDAGITRFSVTKKGVDLTVDLCPSKKHLDRVLFISLIRGLGLKEKPVPVAVAVTGVWMEKHPDDLEWLKSLVRDGELSVTWINHSFSHRVGRNLPMNRNFLLEKGTDIQSEVLKTEIAMLENGLLPSIFFRFPGLVSDEKLFRRVTGFGLIPVGSDAWLGKSMWPKDGSIVLVHANGNEPIGIKRFLNLLHQERGNIIHKQWLLLDLRESMTEQEEAK